MCVPPRQVEELGPCHADGSFREHLVALATVSLMVIGDFAIYLIGPRERADLLEVLDDRADMRATLITSQLPVEPRHDCIGGPNLVDAVLNRLALGPQDPSR
jgi:DNA replication protein DnaC